MVKILNNYLINLNNSPFLKFETIVTDVETRGLTSKENLFCFEIYACVLIIVSNMCCKFMILQNKKENSDLKTPCKVKLKNKISFTFFCLFDLVHFVST